MPRFWLSALFKENDFRWSLPDFGPCLILAQPAPPTQLSDEFELQ
jgi:hypothetical protein